MAWTEITNNEKSLPPFGEQVLIFRPGDKRPFGVAFRSEWAEDSAREGEIVWWVAGEVVEDEDFMESPVWWCPLPDAPEQSAAAP